jgi:hypothetical protein
MNYLIGFPSEAAACARKRAADDFQSDYQKVPADTHWRVMKHAAREEWALEISHGARGLLADHELMALQTEIAMRDGGWFEEVEA